jgi:predicted small secreted protein
MVDIDWHGACRLGAWGMHVASPERPERGTIMKRLIALVVAASFAMPLALLSGCNTVQGAGKDIERGGEKIQKEAVENKKY